MCVCSVVFSFFRFFIIIIFIIFAGFLSFAFFPFCLCVCSTGNSRTRAHLPYNFFSLFARLSTLATTLYSTVDMVGNMPLYICIYIYMPFCLLLIANYFPNSSSSGNYKYCCHMLYISLADRPRNDEHFFKMSGNKKKNTSINKKRRQQTDEEEFRLNIASKGGKKQE